MLKPKLHDRLLRPRRSRKECRAATGSLSLRRGPPIERRAEETLHVDVDTEAAFAEAIRTLHTCENETCNKEKPRTLPGFRAVSSERNFQ
jgi:hypothetical protein